MENIVVAICFCLLSLAKTEVLKGYSFSATELVQEPDGDSNSSASVILPLDPTSNAGECSINTCKERSDWNFVSSYVARSR